MKSSLARLAYAGVLSAGIVLGSMFHVLGSTTPTVFQACLTTGGTLLQVKVSATSNQCPSGTTAVSWNQEGAPGPAGGMAAIREFTSSATLTVPAGVGHLMVEAWGGGGGGSDVIPFPDCISGAGGGSGGYLRTVIAVTPGESLQVTVGSGGAPGADGGTSTVSLGSTQLVAAGGGGGGAATSGPAATIGGVGGTVVSSGGIIRPGNAGGNGLVDFMCQFGPGNPPSTPAGPAGVAIQGSVAPVNSGSAGGQGASFTNNFVAQRGQPGEVIFAW